MNLYCVTFYWIRDCAQQARRHQDTIRNAGNPELFDIAIYETQKPSHNAVLPGAVVTTAVENNWRYGQEQFAER
jgi:hypothetical protein